MLVRCGSRPHILCGEFSTTLKTNQDIRHVTQEDMLVCVIFARQMIQLTSQLIEMSVVVECVDR